MTLSLLTFALSAVAEEHEAPGSQSSIDRVDQGLSGRYLKWGVSMEHSDQTRFYDRNCKGQPAVLYGCDDGFDGHQLSSAGDFGSAGGIELGVGYKPRANLRREVSIWFQPSFRFNGNSNYKTRSGERNQPVRARVSSQLLMFSQYWERPEDRFRSAFTKSGYFVPFVGMGLGVSKLKIARTTMTLPTHYTIVPGGTKFNIAWMLAAGISSPINENITLDVVLRHIDYGEVRTERGPITIDFYDPNRNNLEVEIDETRADYSTWGLQVSLRYRY